MGTFGVSAELGVGKEMSPDMDSSFDSPTLTLISSNTVKPRVIAET